MFVKFSSSAIKIWYFVFFWIHWMENYCMTIFLSWSHWDLFAKFSDELKIESDSIYCIALWLATFYHEIRVDYGVWSFQVLFLVNLYFWSDTFLNVLCQSKNYPIQEEKVIFPVSTLFHLNFVFQFDVVISLFISLFTKNCFNRKPL